MRGRCGIGGGFVGCWRGTAETRGGFLRFDFPVRATKVLGGFAIPLGGFGKLRGGFEEASEFECDHGVFGFFVKIRQLCRRVFTGASAANARGNLFPVRHTYACAALYQREAIAARRDGQHADRMEEHGQYVPERLGPAGCI